MEIAPGVYETLISQAIQEKLQNFPSDSFLVKTENIDSAESYKMLANYLAEVVAGILKDYFRDTSYDKLNACNKIFLVESKEI